jgi:hypothetical protein
MILKKNIKELKLKGITFLNKTISNKDCKQVIYKLDKITKKLRSKKSPNIKLNSQFIPNPFRHDISFLNFIYNKHLDKIFKILIEDNYVLIDSTAINRKKDSTGGLIKDSGTSWHTDTAYLKNKRIKKGLMYLVIYMFEDFSKETSSTLFVPYSFKKEFKPKRNYNYKCKMLKGKQGTIVIMDAAMWHKSGVASNISRWSMFNLYGPWFHKPYFNYYEMLKNKKNVKITKNLKKLLHFNSMPPKNDDIRLTITTKL